MWHNHEENIKKAKKLRLKINSGDNFRIDEAELDILLESMIKDAEEGHARIEELEEKLKIQVDIKSHLIKVMEEIVTQSQIILNTYGENK